MNYICLTSIPSRFSNLIILSEHINKLFPNQFYKIKLYLPKKYIRFPNEYKIPKVKNIEVNIIDKDWGPSTKFIGPLLDLEIKNEDNIFITDDDVIKDSNWIKLSTLYLNKFPTSIIQLRITSWQNKPLTFNRLQIHGVTGFCFKKQILNNENFFNFYNKLPKELYFIDDDILTYYLYVNNINIQMTKEIINRKYLMEKDSLLSQNSNLSRGYLRSRASKYFNFYFLNLI